MSKLKIHLGCGNTLKNGWVNVDCYPPKTSNGTDVLVLDVRQGLPLAVGSVQSIYSEHFFEHIPLYIVREVILPNCFEILEAGGAIRIGVPDGENLLLGYATDNPKGEGAHFMNLKDGQTKMMRCNNLVAGNQHQFLYDYETFLLILKEAGFEDIKKSVSNETERINFQNIDQSDPHRIATTLYVEANKP